MHIGRIAGTTRMLGAPPNWKPERDGLCLSLPIREQVLAGHDTMTSAWLPTLEEISAIVAGAPIHLTIIGNVRHPGHPPVMLTVGAVPEAS